MYSIMKAGLENMKNLIFKIFLFFAFILNFTIMAGFCETLEINSITYDNSGAILSINSFDNFVSVYTNSLVVLQQ